MDFGKIAFNKINDLVRDEGSFLNVWCNTVQLINNQYSFNINAKNRVFINIKANSLFSFKVFVCGELQHFEYGSNNCSFALIINKPSTVLIQGLNDVTKFNLTVVGLFEDVDDSKTDIVLKDESVAIIKSFNNCFNVYNGDTVLNSVNNFNDNNFSQYNYEFLNATYFNNSVYCLVKKDTNFYVLVNFNTEILIKENISNNAKIFSCSHLNSNYGIIDYNLNEVAIILFSENCEVTYKFNKFNLNFLTRIASFKPIKNSSVSAYYFLVTTANKNNFIILCNFNLSTENSEFLKFIQVDDGNINNVVLTKNNEFVFAVKNKGLVKIVAYNFNFENKVKTLKKIQNFKNVLWADVINFNSSVLNFNNNLLLCEDS